jgi:hypothetical protein
MNLETEIAKYETLPSELIGRTIKKVSYFEIDYGEPMFELSDHHSLDYGLQLETDNGETYYMIWDSQYFQYDLKFKKGTLNQELNTDSKINCHDVSLSKYWSDRIGQKLNNIKSYWSYVMTDGKSDKKYYPQDIELIFDNGLNVIVSAIEVRPDGQVSGMADHISVFFDSETAKKYGVKN